MVLRANVRFGPKSDRRAELVVPIVMGLIEFRVDERGIALEILRAIFVETNLF